MHPMDKILVLMAACQIVQLAFALIFLRRECAGARYWVWSIPLIVSVAALVVLVLRIFGFLPYVGI